MPTQERSPRLVHTSTLTDEVYQIRRHLKRMGVVLLLLSGWLGASLMLCSIHPELSTVHTHALGSVSQWLSSALLEHLGLVSFSFCLLIARLGWMLMRLQVPVVSSFDLVSYALINVICTFPLAVFFRGCTLFGAPYGGAVGERFLSLSQGIPSPYLELSSTLVLLFGVVFYLQLSAVYGGPRGSGRRPSGGGADGGAQLGEGALKAERESPSSSRRSSTLELLNTRSVKSAPDKILAHLSATFNLDDEPFEEMIVLETPVPEDQLFQMPPERVSPTPVSPTPVVGRGVPSSPLYSAEINLDSGVKGVLTPLSSEPSIYHRHALHAGRIESHHRPLNRAESSADSRRGSVGGILRDPFQGASRPTDELVQLNKPRPLEAKVPSHTDLSHRKEFIKRAFEQLGLRAAGLQAEVGEVTSAFVVTLESRAQQVLASVESLNVRLNQLVKKSYGRTEPPLLVLPLSKGASAPGDLQITWPHRLPRFTTNKRGIEENRARRRSGDHLMLYLGDLPNGCDVYLPFKDIPSLLVTGGQQTHSQLGVNLLVMSLIYQAREDELRFIVADPSSSRRPTPNPFEAHPQLFSPVLYQSAQVSRALGWLLTELSARTYLMKKARLKSFEELSARSKEPAHRLVMIISELNQLNDEALLLLAQLLDRLERTELDVGVQLVVNTRGLPQTQLTQRVLKSCTRRLALSAKANEAEALGCTGAINLVPQQQDMILDIGTGPVRVHGWFLSPKAYTTFLNTFAERRQVSYVCPDGRFDQLAVPAIHGRARAQAQSLVH